MKINSCQNGLQPNRRIDPRLEAALEEINRQDFINCEDPQLVAGHSIPSSNVLHQIFSILSFPVRPNVLHVGAGLGYACAVLAQVASQVIGIEKDPSMADAAMDRLSKLKLGNVAPHEL